MVVAFLLSASSPLRDDLFVKGGCQPSSLHAATLFEQCLLLQFALSNNRADHTKLVLLDTKKVRKSPFL